MIALDPKREELLLFGRDEELAFLESVTTSPTSSITFVSGIGGIGKSRLLDAFAQRRRAAGAAVVLIDCNQVEPTEDGFYRELSGAVGGDISSCDDTSRRLGELGSVVIIFDSIDALRLLDAWLRRELVPALPPNVHVIFSGRDAPISSWLQTAWRGAFRAIELGPLDHSSAISLLTSKGIALAQAERVNRVARGHPLALTLAAITLERIDDPALEELAFHRIVDALARRHLDEIADPLTRRAVEAAALVRTITLPLLGAMLPDVAPSDVYERLRALPLMRLARDGLMLHDTIRDAIAGALRSSDPERYLSLRRACWRRLTREVRTTPVAELWRYAADLLYLLENPVVREAFFPSNAQRYAVELAQSSDAEAISAITAAFESGSARRASAAWWTHVPQAFSVARERNRDVCGYYVLCERAQLPTVLASEDPVLQRWLDHLEQNPVAPGDRVLFLRRWLSRSEGEAPCAVQAACWLDIKRTYLTHRPHLRRVYLAVHDLIPYAAAATQLGFTVLDDCAVSLDDQMHFTAMLDFGADSVDGWLARLVAAELGIGTSRLLDVGGRELVVGSRRTPLTPREFDTLYYLVQRAGKVVHRGEIITDVWGDTADVSSNVVDVVVRSLRKKLDENASVIETISGIGYRLRDEA